MRIFRIAKTQYIDDLSGEGARLYGGRWNKTGDPMLYFSENLSLSLLEIIVHIEFAQLPLDYSFIEVEIPDEAIKTLLSIDFINPKWTTEAAVNQLQMFGSGWLKKQESLAMRVPSAILSLENNILINPAHLDSGKLKVVRKGKFSVDPRLVR